MGGLAMPQCRICGLTTWLLLTLIASQGIVSAFRMCGRLPASGYAEFEYNGIATGGRLLYPENQEITLKCRSITGTLEFAVVTLTCDLSNNSRIHREITGDDVVFIFVMTEDFHNAECHCESISIWGCNLDTTDLVLHVVTSDGSSATDIGVSGFAAMGAIGGLVLAAPLTVLLVRYCLKRSKEKAARSKIIKVKQQKAPYVVSVPKVIDDQTVMLSEIPSDTTRSGLHRDAYHSHKPPAVTDHSRHVFQLPPVTTSIPSAPPIRENSLGSPVPIPPVPMPPTTVNTLPQGIRSTQGLISSFPKSGDSLGPMFKPLSNEFTSSPPAVNSSPLAFSLFPPGNSAFPPMAGSMQRVATPSSLDVMSEFPPTTNTSGVNSRLPPLTTKPLPSLISPQADVLSLLPANDM